MTTSTYVLVALGPAVVVIPLVLAGVFAGLFKLLGKKGTAPSPSIAAAPFLDMTAGTTTAHLERKGTLWQWSLAGAATTAGSDADAGKAAVAMATALIEAVPDTPLVGTAGGPQTPEHDFGVQSDGDGGWDWTITTPSKLPNIGDKPAPPSMVASGFEETLGGATIRMLAKLSGPVAWLDVIDPGGKVGGAGIPGVKQLPGLVISGSTVAVTDLPTWVAYAAPKMREWIDDGATADELMDAIVADLPEGATLSGKPIADVRARVTELLGMLRDGAYVAVAAPDEQLAAFIVGAQLRDPTWVASEYKGYVILVRPAAGGPPGTHWKWDVWRGGVRGYDDAAEKSETMPLNKTRTQAESAAKAYIDGTTVNPDWKDQQGVEPMTLTFIPPPKDSEAFQPPVKHISLAGAKFGKPNQQDIELFDFKDKQFYTFKHWRIVIGVCMRPTDTPSPFGMLSAYLASGDVESLAKMRIVNSDVQDGAIGPPPPVAWSSFRKPLMWKAQLDGMVHAGPTIGIDPFHDVTGTGAGEQVDPCEDEPASWPTPSNDDAGFWVLPAGSTKFVQWMPAPQISLITKGTKVLARVVYRGFPVFVLGGGDVGYAQAGSMTKFRLAVKIWAAGTNEEQ